MPTIKLQRPLTLPLKVPGGKAEQVNELALDFDKLTGADILAADRAATLGNGGSPTLNRYLSADFQLATASRASGIDPDTLSTLGAFDFAQMLATVQSFFMFPASETEPEGQPEPSATPSSS
jgi:hypothetical protein